jgi:HAD superfamily hydrolase (TIGR01509 family)
MGIRLLIFDFDGVVADSERLACETLVNYARDLGVPMTCEDAIEQFVGKRIDQVASAIEELAQRPLPGFVFELQERTLADFEGRLREVSGLSGFLKNSRIPRCIASSSSKERIGRSLKILKLEEEFEGVYSAQEVAHGKPAPDLFLRAASMQGVGAEDSVVIEDSALGVQAAVRANMPVIGLLAASHLNFDHEAKLKEAGATHLASDYEEVARILASL